MLPRKRARPLCVPPAPVLHPAGDPDEGARPDTLLARLVLIAIRPLEHDELDIVRVRVHPHIEPRHELGERAVRPRIGVARQDRLRHAGGRVLELRRVGGAANAGAFGLACCCWACTTPIDHRAAQATATPNTVHALFMFASSAGPVGTDCNHSALSRGGAWGHRGLVELTPYHPPQGIELPVMLPEVPPWLLPPGRCLSGGQRCPASLPVAPASGDGPRLTADVGAMAGMVGASRRAVPRSGRLGVRDTAQ